MLKRGAKFLINLGNRALEAPLPDIGKVRGAKTVKRVAGGTAKMGLGVGRAAAWGGNRVVDGAIGPSGPIRRARNKAAFGGAIAVAAAAGAGGEVLSPKGPWADAQEGVSGSRQFLGQAAGASIRASMGPRYQVRQGNIGYYNGRSTRTNMYVPSGGMVFGMSNTRKTGVL